MPLLTAYGFEFEGLPEAVRVDVPHEVLQTNASGTEPAEVQVTKAKGVLCSELSRDNTDLWARFCSSVAWEKKDTRDDIINDLTAIRDLSASGVPAPGQNEAEARRPWDSVVEQCLRNVSTKSADFHVEHRLEREVAFPRNALFDLVVTLSQHQITAIAKGRTNTCSTLIFRENDFELPPKPPNDSPSFAVYEWLESVAKDLPGVMRNERQRLSALASQWGEKLSQPNYLDLKCRALQTFNVGICDLVVFVTVPNIFTDEDLKTDDRESRVKNLNVIGAYVPRDGSQRKEGSTPAEETDASNKSEGRENRQQDQRMLSPPVESSDEAKSQAPSSGFRAVDERRPPMPVGGSFHQKMREVIVKCSNIKLKNPKPSTSQYESLDLKHLRLPVLLHEYKRPDQPIHQPFNQVRNYILSSTKFYACLDIFEFKVFGLATIGHKGLLLCAWAEKIPGSKEVDVFIADVNCPEFDISLESDIIRYRTFITQLRTVQAKKAYDAFAAKKEQFLQDWQRNAKDRRFRWTSRAQQTGNATQTEKEITALREDLKKERAQKKAAEMKLAAIRKELEAISPQQTKS
ncbi:hypothetical protein FB107DRAFT_275597 [Schizophyllum commune]